MPPRSTRTPEAAAPLVSSSRAMARVLEQIAQVANSRTPVLLTGETGSGRERVARAIHEAGPRRARRFEVVRLGAIPALLLERALFGAAGEEARPGAVVTADGGTLLLDEVDHVPPAIQVKLLQLLQERAVEPPGGGAPRRVDVRLLATTERDLAAERAAGRFRADLEQRLAAVRIDVPPLRERTADLPVLIAALIQELNREHGRRVRGITHGALDRLVQHDWPGNVRELRVTLEGMLVHAAGRGPLDLSDLPASLRPPEPDADALSLSVGMTVEEAERRLIEATLRHTGNDKVRAAAMLGIGLRTLYRKLQPARRR